MAYLLIACQALLVAVFAASGIGKARTRGAWSSFVQSLRGMRIVPARAVVPVAAGTVGTELLTVVLLATPVTALAGLLLATVLLAAFTAAIVVTTRRGVRAVCRCFGRASALPLGTRHVVRNGLLLAVTAAGAAAAAGTGSGLTPSWAGADPAGLVVAVMAGLVAATVLVFFDEIVDLFAAPPAGQTE